MDELKHPPNQETSERHQQQSSKMDRIFAAQHLKDNKKRIIDEWEAEVRRQVPEARERSSLVLSNTLPIFIDELITALQQEHPPSGVLPISGMSKQHGEQRAALPGYFLPQLLLEFSILRCVISRELFEYEALSFEVQLTINTLIDSAVSLAATKFANVQNEKIKSALVNAESSNRDLEEFAAVAAHDLKSPLATVIGFLDLLREEIEPTLKANERQNMTFMKAALERMTRLIDQLLEYAQIGNLAEQFARVRMSDALTSATQNLRDAIMKSEAKVMSGSLPSVLGNEQLLTQVFQNLIANAIKFRGTSAPEIQIEVKDQDGEWLFSVKDNGIGFDPKYKDQIFGLYKRLATKDGTSGTGIGLATCRKVIERHHGRIWAESEPGKGSIFYFTLPKLSQSTGTH